MGRMSKIRVAFDAKDDLKGEFTVKFKEKDDLKDEKKGECSKKDDLKDDIHRRPQVEVHTKPQHQLVQVSSLHRKKNRLFVEIFPSRIWNCRFFAIYLQHRKTFDKLIRSHIHPHNRVFFETTRYLSSKGRVQ